MGEARLIWKPPTLESSPAGTPATNLVDVFQLVNNLADHWLGTFHLHLVVARVSFCSVPCDMGAVSVE